MYVFPPSFQFITSKSLPISAQLPQSQRKQVLSKTSGTKFTLNGAPYTLTTVAPRTDINKAFVDIVASGATTVRTWGFIEVTSANGAYFHLGNGKTATVNTGANGLGRLVRTLVGFIEFT
ncbi:hypothetical protein B0H14DRAFT_2343699 [Mycena olivaceomarginata]|nr:hypothetical protein B0H14DRAFT_2343699 [Mycena olivaceomarginata]